MTHDQMISGALDAGEILVAGDVARDANVQLDHRRSLRWTWTGRKIQFREARNEAGAAGANALLLLRRTLIGRLDPECAAGMRITDCAGRLGAWFDVRLRPTSVRPMRSPTFLCRTQTRTRASSRSSKALTPPHRELMNCQI
jgi:hypothetical protein